LPIHKLRQSLFKFKLHMQRLSKFKGPNVSFLLKPYFPSFCSSRTPLHGNHLLLLLISPATSFRTHHHLSPATTKQHHLLPFILAGNNKGFHHPAGFIIFCPATTPSPSLVRLKPKPSPSADSDQPPSWLQR
jgi:hypothetical protein